MWKGGLRCHNNPRKEKKTSKANILQEWHGDNGIGPLISKTHKKDKLLPQKKRKGNEAEK